MKKLMIAACAIALAGVVQAASYTWNSLSPLYTYDSADPDWPTVAAGTTAYFVFATAYSQTDLLSDFVAGTVDYTKLSAAGNGAITADGTINPTSASGDYTTAQQAYFVVFQDDKNMFVSGEVTAPYDALSGANVTFDYDQVEGLWTGTSLNASDGYAGGAWYAASSSGGGESVPEPTSGLLMLIGAAGLALRRKRA